MGKIANRQSLAFSERGQLSQAIPQFHVERMLNERRVCEDKFLCFRGRYDRQRTLAIRIAAITLAGDSATTMASFCPSKCLMNSAHFRHHSGPKTDFFFLFELFGRSRPSQQKSPKGPKIEKIQDRPPALKLSSETENCKRATHPGPSSCGKF